MRKLATYAFSHNVQELIISSSPKNGRVFPPCLFSSRTLKRFTLTTIFPSLCFTPTTPWGFPALTCLNLSDITLGTRGPGELFSKCVNLKNLTLKRFIVVATTVFDINTPRLSNLVLIEGRGSGVNNVIAPQLENLTVISCSIESFNATPRLSSLYYEDDYSPPTWFKDGFPSLNKVTVNLSLYNSYPYKEEDACKAVNMLQDLHSAKFLTLNLDIVECISSFPNLVSPHPSPFRNLICLNIDSSKREYHKVKMSTEARNFLLENSPNATFTMDSLKEEPTKAMKAKEAREKKKAKLVEDIHSHMTEWQSLLKQENTLERKQWMEYKKKIVENLMAGLQHVLTSKKLMQSEPERAQIEGIIVGLKLQIVNNVEKMDNIIQHGYDDILAMDSKKVLVRSLLENLPKLQKAVIEANYSAQTHETETLCTDLRSTFQNTTLFLNEIMHVLKRMRNSQDASSSKIKPPPASQPSS